MLEPDPSFRPVRARDGYLPLEDLGLIGDGATVALAGLDGGIGWLCLPRFDSEPLLCGLLDRDHGGCFRITPVWPDRGAAALRARYRGAGHRRANSSSR
jgi:alpha,alpha-trehalase